jgi:hypothetical protein
MYLRQNERMNSVVAFGAGIIGSIERAVVQAASIRGLRVAVIVIAFVISLLITRSVSGVVQLRSSSTPAFVDMPWPEMEALLDPTSKPREQYVWTLVSKVHAAGGAGAAGSAAAGLLVTLRPRGFSLDFDRLNADQRRLVIERFGGNARDRESHSNGDERVARVRYEHAMAGLLTDVMQRARSQNAAMRISVFGLPIEGDSAANRRYADAIAGLSAFVTSRLEDARERDGDVSSVSGAFPAALELAAGRPIYYRSGNSWMVAMGALKNEPAPKPAAKGASGSKASGGGGGGGGGAKASGKKGKGGGGGGGGRRGGGGAGGSVPVVKASSSSSSTPTGSGGSQQNNNQPPPPPSPIAPPRPKLYVAENVSAQTQALFTQNRAEKTMLVYAISFDPDNNGMFEHDELFRSSLNELVPAGYTGPVALDWEGTAIHGLQAPIGSEVHTRSVQQYVNLIRRAKELRPNAKWGYYGLPIGRYWGRNDEWRAMATALMPIFEESRALFPSVYDAFKSNETPNHDPQEDLAVTRDIVKLALQVSQGKPVYPFVWPRYDPNNLVWGFKLIDDREFTDNAKAIFETNYQGDKADGLIWWGADPYWRWLSLQNYSPSHPEYSISQRLRAIFEQEIPEGQTDEVHFNRIHRHTLELLSQTIDRVVEGH